MKHKNQLFKNELQKLDVLLSQGQFELLFPDEMHEDLRLVFLMNDAVESFLVFQQASLTGIYQPEFEGAMWGEFEQADDRFVFILHQEDTICTIFFQELSLDVHLYDYGKTGHFWVEGYEYLRQLEYRIAILHDKLTYLGKEFCTSKEQELAALSEFPPLNFSCYPSVSETYLVPGCAKWKVSKEALSVMKNLAKETQDITLVRWLSLYEKIPWRGIAKKIASMLHTTKHAAVVDFIHDELAAAASVYPERSFGARENTILQKALTRKSYLEEEGKKVTLLKEEPFVNTNDTMEYKIHLMIWKKKGRHRIVTIETIME